MDKLDDFAAASARATARRAAGPIAVAARYDARAGRIVIALNTGIEISFAPADAQGLENASSAELRDVRITPSGLGLHFPRLDADLYLPALLEGLLGSRRWMASRLGTRGGKAKTEAKRAAARENGKRGGRPRKKAVRNPRNA